MPKPRGRRLALHQKQVDEGRERKTVRNEQRRQKFSGLRHGGMMFRLNQALTIAAFAWAATLAVNYTWWMVG